MVETRQLTNFLAVAEAGSFRGASKAMKVGQSTVSRRVQRLEDELGVSLFERNSTGAKLTVAGNRFADDIRHVLSDQALAVERVRSAGIADKGSLKIGVIASLSDGSLRTVLQDFLARHEDVAVSVTEADRSELLTLLSHRRIDAVLLPGDPEERYGDGIVVTREEIYLAVASNHVWAKAERIAWDEIKNASFIVSAREPGPEVHDYILRRVSDFGQSAEFERHRVGREGLMVLVGFGLGVSIVCNHWRGVTYPNVTFVPVGEASDSVPFSVSWSADNDNPALRRFISLARVEAKKNGALS